MDDSNLHLEYKFTDRGGSRVYIAFHEDDRSTRHRPLFEIRIHPDSIEILPEPVDPALEDNDDA